MTKPIGKNAADTIAGNLPLRAQVLFHAGRRDEALSAWRSSPAAGAAPAALQAARALARRGWGADASALLDGVASRSACMGAEISSQLAAAWLETGAVERAAEAFSRLAEADSSCVVARLGMAAARPSGVPLTALLTDAWAQSNPLIRTLLKGDPDGADVERAIGDASPDNVGSWLYWWLGWRIAAPLGHGFTARACLRRSALAMPDDLVRIYDFAATCLRVGGVGYIADAWSALPADFAETTPSRLVAAAIALNGDKVARALAEAGFVLEQSGGDEPIAQAVAGYALTMMARDAHVRSRFKALMAHGARRATQGGALAGEAAALSVALTARAKSCLAAVIAAQETAEAWNDMGHLHACLDDLPAAENSFTRALALNPTQRNATINLAVIRLRGGDTAGLADYLRDTVFLADLPPSLKRYQDRAGEFPIDINEWRRGTVFSYAWRRSLADMLAGGCGP